VVAGLFPFESARNASSCNECPECTAEVLLAGCARRRRRPPFARELHRARDAPNCGARLGSPVSTGSGNIDAACRSYDFADGRMYIAWHAGLKVAFFRRGSRKVLDLSFIYED